MGRKTKWTTARVELLKEYYPSMLLKELEQLIGVSAPLIRYKAKELGLQHSVYYHERRGDINRENSLKANNHPRWDLSTRPPHTEEAKKKIGEGRRRVYNAERRRVLFGLPQKTKIKVRI